MPRCWTALLQLDSGYLGHAETTKSDPGRKWAICRWKRLTSVSHSESLPATHYRTYEATMVVILVWLRHGSGAAKMSPGAAATPAGTVKENNAAGVCRTWDYVFMQATTKGRRGNGRRRQVVVNRARDEVARV